MRSKKTQRPAVETAEYHPYGFVETPPDRSYLVIGGWIIGLAVTVMLFFRWGGGTIPTSAAPKETPETVAPLQFGTSLPAAQVARPNSVLQNPTALLRNDVRIVPDRLDTRADKRSEHWSCSFVNDSKRSVLFWKARLTFFDETGLVIEEKEVSSSELIRPSERRRFVFDRSRSGGAATRLRALPIEVQFEEVH